ncbi:MAG: DUF3240 family protein [Gammaproteobacteria bacterium]|nr:DUF3240 domain-containing protein [Rhodocyclaceae bacterium]MBU3910087.1 DUF3240 family protein [Gammaproteobacteria bacterium]MBU3989428.1 DUF3240 family protein [Gammaproteobacteria bacterium]MBU4003914.1 DUF3240 family protein [Gammaproteobacteria bacterium]MBU4022549.1 DUF3240 family protein [Gammaproteobacteria bacterium]
MTKRLDVCLTLLLTKGLEARILDHLLQHPVWVGPFTVQHVEGHGDPAGITSAYEQVRGRADWLRIEILMDSSHVTELLDELRTVLPSPAVAWWLSPVLDSGSLA